MYNALEWIILITENYDGMKTFYRDALSFPIERDIPDEQFTQFKAENCFVTIFGKTFVEKLLETIVTGKPGSTIYSLKESSDVDSDYQQLKSKGVQFIQPPKTQIHGQRTAFFKDPDGNIWEIQQWIKK
jgi:uncharacterized glyoxalase superfamily protein PhnB